MEQEFLLYIGQGISWLIRILVLIACIILVIKYKSTPFKMMLIGTILSIFFGIAGTVVFTLRSFDFSMEQIIFYNGLISILQALAYSLFGLGLFLFALKNKRPSAN